MNVIVRHKEHQTVQYWFDDHETVQLLPDRLLAPSLRALDIKETTHELVFDVPEPDIFLGGGALKWDGTRWTVVDQERLDQAIQYLKKELLQQLALKRFKQQSSGIVHNDVVWFSDQGGRSSLAETIQLASIYEEINGDGSFSTVWKAQSGWTQVTLTDLKNAASAIGAYIQACFIREKEIIDILEPLTTKTELESVFDSEINKGWPNNGIRAFNEQQ